MSSFFIPDLGSQIYAMAGMVTHLNLLADRPGKFVGHNLEFSGVGYSSMNFTVNALTKEQFEAWKQTAKGQGNSLTQEQFDKMNTPKSGLPADTFGSVESNLFGKIVAKFMSAKATTSGAATDAAMPMPDEKK
jgi:cytochrome o ubiquinol oxidase subunit 2